MTATIDLDMLASDLGDMLDKYDYPIDVPEAAIRAALPAFIAAAEAAALAIPDEPSIDAATWAPTAEAGDEAPVAQGGRPPKMTYVEWHRSQTVELGATARNQWYWRCPKAGCRVWAGPYRAPVDDDGAYDCKRTGMNHVFYEHDMPAARATEQRRADRKAARLAAKS